MKSYLGITSGLFGLLVVVHLWRFAVEGMHLMHEPWWILITLVALAMCLWGLRLLRSAARS